MQVFSSNEITWCIYLASLANPEAAIDDEVKSVIYKARSVITTDDENGTWGTENFQIRNT